MAHLRPSGQLLGEGGRDGVADQDRVTGGGPRSGSSYGHRILRRAVFRRKPAAWLKADRRSQAAAEFPTVSKKRSRVRSPRPARPAQAQISPRRRETGPRAGRRGDQAGIRCPGTARRLCRSAARRDAPAGERIDEISSRLAELSVSQRLNLRVESYSIWPRFWPDPGPEFKLSATKRIVIAGVSTRWGRNWRGRRSAGPGSARSSASIQPRPPPISADRVRRGGHPQPGHLPHPSLAGTGTWWFIAGSSGTRKRAGLQGTHDINVIGTPQLLAACEKTSGLQALIARGSAAIYGSAPGAPAFTEDMARRLPLVTRFQRDIGELEGYFDNFARRRPEITPLHAPLRGRGWPRPRHPLQPLPEPAGGAHAHGFRPRLQLLHVDDATRGAGGGDPEPGAGAVNVAPTARSAQPAAAALRKERGRRPPVLVGVINRRIGNYLGSADLYRDGELLSATAAAATTAGCGRRSG